MFRRAGRHLEFVHIVLRNKNAGSHLAEISHFDQFRPSLNIGADQIPRAGSQHGPC